MFPLPHFPTFLGSPCRNHESGTGRQRTFETGRLERNKINDTPPPPREGKNKTKQKGEGGEVILTAISFNGFNDVSLI